MTATAQAGDVKTLLHELKRRRVFRVAGIYGVVAWVVGQVADVIFPALQLPEWTITFVVALLILGFPVAMIFAWVFDIGPQGIERTEPLAERVAGMPNLERAGYILLLVVAMGVLGYLLYPRIDGPDEGAARDSIAVLPFTNLSEDPSNEYFSDGMSEELLNLLAKVPNLRVAARTSSFAYRDSNLDVREVARQLGVATVLEGSVRRAGSKVRITAQLIDAESGYHLWSQTYDRELEDIFAVQDEISTQIVQALRVTLGAEEEMPIIARAAPPTDNVQAYQAYLQARHQWKRRGAEALANAIELLEEALALDPEFARAYAALAAAYVVYPGYAQVDAEDWNRKASEAAMQALARDPNLAEAHAVLAELDMEAGNWTDAEAAFYFATNLDPNDATARHWYSLLLRRAGRLKKSLEVAQEALRLDPASPVANNNLAETYMTLGYDEQALNYYRAAADLGFDTTSNVSLVELMAADRRGDDETWLRIVSTAPGTKTLPDEFFQLLSAVRKEPSRWPELDRLMAEAEIDLPQSGLFTAYLLTGRTAGALDIALTDPGALSANMALIWLPEAAELRRMPRFGELVEKIGLVEYWKQYGWPDDCRPLGDDIQCGLSVLATSG
jgi:TolB-like protein/Flp pilus assembly protein TadD